MEQRIGYLILLTCVGILIWAAWMGTEKMIKLILGNAVIAGVCFAFGNCIDLWANQLWAYPDFSFLGIGYESLSSFLHNGQLTFTLLLFAGLVALVYAFSTIEVGNIQHSSVEKLYYILLIPLTLLSFIFAVYIACMANGVQAMDTVTAGISGTFVLIGGFINNISLWMLVHGILVIVITSHIKIKFSFAMKTTVLPEWLDEL